MSEEGPRGNKQRDWSYWLQIVSAGIMSAAIVLSAFSAWQATRWSGVQSIAFAEASALRTQALNEFGTANAQTAYDAIIFSEFAIEFRGALDDPALLEEAEEVSQRLVRDEFRTALEAWIALEPNENPDVPQTPFELPEYTNARQEEGERLQLAAEEKAEEAKDANQNGDDYILSTVFLASVLFFAGVATKFEVPKVEAMLLAMALLGLIAGLVRIITLPIH